MNKHRVSASICLYFTLLAALPATVVGEATPAPTVMVIPDTLCPLGSPTEIDGHRRLALIVGVGDYQSADVIDLRGPPNDARQVYDLLTGALGQGYGFPPENVCLLIDEQATMANLRTAFEGVLVQGARMSKDDVALFYYAGHGSQVRDRNGDEADHCDETLLLHDARTGAGQSRVADLIDDEFNAMLGRLHGKTSNIIVILDSCNSGTATRGRSEWVARWQDPDDPAAACPSGLGSDTGTRSGWQPAAMPGLVTFTAASDGTLALERNGRGLFTTALIGVLTQGVDRPLTYAQVARQVPPLVAAGGYQIPYFQGDLGRPIFDVEGRRRPFGWDVTAVGETVELSGAPLPGMGQGAELRVYDGAITGSAAHDPAKAKATLVVTASTDINARASVSAKLVDAPAIALGDLAILVRPSDQALRIKVRLRPESESGGVAKARANKLRELIEKDNEAAMLVELVAEGDSFELSIANGRLVLRGPENNIRNDYRNDSEVPESLWRHARLQALLKLRGEGGADFVDHQTLQARLVLAKKQTSDALGEWKQAQPNSEQAMLQGYRWNLEVTLAKESNKPLLVGAIILSSDGGSFGLPCDGRAIRLQPGERITFDAERKSAGCGETFMAQPPLNTQDHVIVFGTQETNPVPWHLMTENAHTRGERGRGGPLYHALDRYMRPGMRGQGRVAGEEIEETTWTMSSVTMRVRKAEKVK